MTNLTETHCHYCGLPVPASWWDKHQPSGEPSYCCFGCRFAASVTKAGGEQGQTTWALTRLGLALFFTMNVMVFSMVLWSQDLFETSSDAETATFISLFRYLCLLLALPVLLLLGVPLLENAVDSCKRGQPTMDVLILLGVVAAYLYSTYSVLQESGKTYFEVGCMVLVLVTLGRWVEAHAKWKTTEAIQSLQKLLPETVRCFRGGQEEMVPLDEVPAGEQVRVLPGERIPLDGLVQSKQAVIDEQILTGESTPSVKKTGDKVFGGTLNLESTLLLKTTESSSTGVLARLVQVMEEARRNKSHYERLADRLSFWILPLIVSIALVAFLVHTIVFDLAQGILVGLAVTLIACPCALGIATPLAVWVALGQAARHQVLIRNGEILETLARVRSLFLDKTGTLTTGTSTVVDFVAQEETTPDAYKQALVLASGSTHVHSQAIRTFLSEREVEESSRNGPISTVQSHPGRGLSVQDDGREFLLGNLRWLTEKGLQLSPQFTHVVEEATHKARSITAVGWQDQVRGLFILEEQLRPEAKEALTKLKQSGLQVTILTGDNRTRGQAIAEELQVPVQAELLPQDKLDFVKKASQKSHLVGMVGDGINDAPALLASDVGIAMGCGVDVTRDSAAVCLLNNDLTRLPWILHLSQRTVSIIRQNLFWAFAYNIIGVGLACTGQLNPILAALAMAVSSLVVVGNSLRLRSTQEEQTI